MMESHRDSSDDFRSLDPDLLEGSVPEALRHSSWPDEIAKIDRERFHDWIRDGETSLAVADEPGSNAFSRQQDLDKIAQLTTQDWYFDVSRTGDSTHGIDVRNFRVSSKSYSVVSRVLPDPLESLLTDCGCLVIHQAK